MTRKGASRREELAAGEKLGRQLISPYFSQYVSNASDEAVVEFASVMVDIFDSLRTRKDKLCFVWMFGGGETANTLASEAISEEKQERMLEVMAEVLESALSSESKIMDYPRAEQILEEFMLSMADKRGDGFLATLAELAHPHEAGVDRKGVCDVAAALYKEALLLPKGEREILLRYLFAAEG